MKARSERLAENALRELKQTLERNITDISTVLDLYEATHNEQECCYNKPYQALMTGWFAIQEAVSKVNYQLNKK